MKTVTIKNDCIKLGQAMKLGGMVSSGLEAKLVIQDGKVKVNGETEYQRGKKLYNGDVICFKGEVIRIHGN